MDKATEDLLAKVRKLMALGTSPSEAEAASALEKARTLLARHGLTVADVEMSEPGVTEGVLLEKRRLRAWESHLVYVVTLATFTEALHVQRGDTGQVLIIGREVNTVSATELFNYLHLTVLKLGRTWSPEVSHLESFKAGVVQRIGERLSEQAGGREKVAASRTGASHRTGAAETGSPSSLAADRQLVVLMTETAEAENRSYIAERYGKTKTRRTGRSVEAESYLRGRQAGDGVSLNRQLR